MPANQALHMPLPIKRAIVLLVHTGQDAEHLGLRTIEGNMARSASSPAKPKNPIFLYSSRQTLKAGRESNAGSEKPRGEIGKFNQKPP